MRSNPQIRRSNSGNANLLIGYLEDAGNPALPSQWRRRESNELQESPLAAPKNAFSETPCAKSGALGAGNTPLDPDLALIQDRWPKLPEHFKAAVLAIVRNASEQ